MQTKLTSHPWKGRTCFAIQCFRLLCSDWLSIFRIFLRIHSSVDVAICSINWSRIPVNTITSTTRQKLHAYNNSIVVSFISSSHSICIGFLCSYTSIDFFVGPAANGNNPIRGLLKVDLNTGELVSFIWHFHAHWKFSVHLSSIIHKLFRFIISSLISYWCASTTADLSNTKWLKYPIFYLRCDVNITAVHQWLLES